jgi:D-xylose transport system permease protein
VSPLDTTGSVEDPTEAPDAVAVEVPPQLVAQSLGDFFRVYIARVRAGDSGVLPVIFGLVLISAVFQAISPSHVYLSPGNLVNLFQQSAVFMVLAMAEAFPLLLGEIDLSVGYTAGFGAAITVQLVQASTTNWPWWLAIIAGLAVCALFGAFQGTIISRLGVPSFVVTLFGFLFLFGAMLQVLLLGPFSGYPSLTGRGGNVAVVYDLMWGVIDPVVSWVGMLVVVALIGVGIWRRDASRRSSGLVAPPASLTLLKIAAIAVTGVVVVAICDINRAAVGTLAGLPWVIPIVLAVFGAWTMLLQRTRYGRYVYAIGGNREAARRAGVNVAAVVTIAFVLCSLTAGIGGLLYASYLGGMSNNVNGGQLVLYAVAAAVIGGTSLFGGRGKVIHGVLGGLVIGAIYNGMYLLSLQVQWQFIVTGFVLLAAATIDAVSRRAR